MASFMISSSVCGFGGNSAVLGGNSAVAVALDIEDNNGVTGEERPSPIIIAAERVRPEGAVKLVGVLASSDSRALNMFLIFVGTCLTGKSPSVTPRGLGRLDAGSGSPTIPMNGCMAATKPSSMALTGPLLPLVGQSLAR
jgi:hypothetical protein